MLPNPALVIVGRILAVVSTLLILAGAAGIVAGTLGPWATFRVFHNIEINLPGIIFLGGGLCLSVAAVVFLGARRSPMLCLVGALAVLYWSGEAQKRVPERVKFQLAGSQLVLASTINRLLDQFHIPDIEVANFGTPNAELLGEGLDWTLKGATVLLLGSVVGLPIDPLAVWVFRRTARVRCRFCSAKWLLSRHARFCPSCGESTLPASWRLCPQCGTRAKKQDQHCVSCGTAI
jgi:ribosomal protein L32